MDKSVPPVTVWHHLAEPRDAKTVTLGTALSVCTSHSCQILIFHTLLWTVLSYSFQRGNIFRSTSFFGHIMMHALFLYVYEG